MNENQPQPETTTPVPSDAAVQDGFLRVAAATPKVRVGDVAHNAEVVLAAIREAHAQGAAVLVLPELSLTGYTCGDLFHDAVLLRASERALADILNATADLPILFAVGVPVAHRGAIYNCAAVCCAGELLGLTVKENLPNYGEFYERRWFTPAPFGENLGPVEFAGRTVEAFGSRIVYRCADAGFGNVAIGVEICEDLWVASPPSTDMARAGATIVLNTSASVEAIGKAEYRRELVRSHSARLYCAYVYANAGVGESTTDILLAGEDMVAENGVLLVHSEPFECGMVTADVDLARLAAERRRSNTWTEPGEGKLGVQNVEFSFGGAHKTGAPAGLLRSALDIDRIFPRTPFVPAEDDDLASRCEAILDMQTVGLATRLEHTRTERVVVGVSGGLDSTLALLVAVRAFDRLGLARTGVEAISMPGFGTTHRTRSNAQNLAEQLGVGFREVSIAAAVEQHFADIGHDPNVRNAAYENAQARERTQVLMDVANDIGGFVVGTGDLSELALGWATYNGDHMSMYGVNASVPKTLVRHLVRYAAEALGGEARATLLDVLATPVSPELLPPAKDGSIAQLTEDEVGPYELHDYFLYYMTRFGFAPGRIFRQACRSFEGAYEPATILKWLRVFYRRFFSQQFKRSCLPDGPKVGSVSLSPRGDWRMPSDASAELWLVELDALEASL